MIYKITYRDVVETTMETFVEAESEDMARDAWESGDLDSSGRVISEGGETNILDVIEEATEEELKQNVDNELYIRLVEDR